MKKGLLVVAAASLATLAGCAIVPADYGPGYAAPHYGASVVISPSHGHRHYGPSRYDRRWRGHRH